MSAEYVRSYYRVPAKRGMRIVADGKPGTIVGFAGAHLRIRLDGEKRIGNWHPTWRIEYPEVAMNTLPDGVGSIDTIYNYDESDGILVRLTKEVDLDDLLVHLADRLGGIDGDCDWHLDEPTTLPGYSFIGRGREADIAWFRKQVCVDGDHSWDMALVSTDKPEGAKRYGAFLGVFLG